MRLISLVFLMALAISVPAASWAWDVYYDAAVLPNDASLGTDAWLAQGDVTTCSICAGALCIATSGPADGVSFSRSAAPARSPLTVEARVCVAAGSSATLYAGTPSYAPQVNLYSDHLTAYIGPNGFVTCPVDLSSFSTVRVATEMQGGFYVSYVWVDGILLAQGAVPTCGNDFDVIFGSFWVFRGVVLGLCGLQRGVPSRAGARFAHGGARWTEWTRGACAEAENAVTAFVFDAGRQRPGGGSAG